MDYREAKKIREKSFGTLLAEQEGGFGQSFQKALSQKTKARVAGIKEAFDPLNIAKKLTGGSNFAPALLGKLIGADKKRIDYFSGVKPKYTASLESGSSSLDSPEALESLGYIYKSLKQSIDDKHQAEADAKEAKQKEEEYENKCNEELVKALTGRRKKKEKPYRDEKGRFAKRPTEEKLSPTKETPKNIGKNKTTAIKEKTFNVTPQARTTVGTAAITTTATKVAAVAAITTLGVSKAAAISIKGETGSTDKNEILKKGAQIVPNDPKPGVFSYGIFGMNSAAGTVDQFIAQNPQLGFKEKPGTPAFNEEWKKISNANPKAFFDAQIQWHERNILKPLEKDLQKNLPSAVPLDEKILTYMADRRIQYGKMLEADAFKYASTATNSTEFITKITDFDLSTIRQAFPTYLSNHPGAEKGLKNRIENRRTLSMELTKNDTGNKIDSSSKENKNLKADTKQSDKATPIVNSNTTNQTNKQQSSPVNPGDDTNAYSKKAKS